MILKFQKIIALWVLKLDKKDVMNQILLAIKKKYDCGIKISFELKKFKIIIFYLRIIKKVWYCI